MVKKDILTSMSIQKNQRLKSSLNSIKMDGRMAGFIISCRKGQAHQYDIVEGPMADDNNLQLSAKLSGWKDFKSCFLGIGKIQVSNASNQFSYNFSTGYIEICRK